MSRDKSPGEVVLREELVTIVFVVDDQDYDVVPDGISKSGRCWNLKYSGDRRTRLLTRVVVTVG